MAALAMLLSRSYADVVALLASCPHPVEPGSWATSGTSFYHLDWALADAGAFVQRRYRSWDWDMEPFAPVHYASVVQPSGNSHFVVVAADGSVLDPLREGVYALSDWTDVNHITGVVWP